jgi:hypothetical protein
MSIGDPKEPTPETQRFVGIHFLTALGALVFASLVHAIVLTYFMGTGRWMEETSRAYRLNEIWLQRSTLLKYRTIMAMSACLLLLILTGGFGAAADPASPVRFQGWWGVEPGMIHFLIAVVMFSVNAMVNYWEYMAIDRNGALIEEVLAEVRRIRVERGLPV